MTLQQGVVVASWDLDKGEYLAQVGGESIEGIGAITRQLGQNGWEIISVVTLESASAATGAPSKANFKSRTATDVLAIFIKRYQTVAADAAHGESP
jgi:hypothetical protein